MSDKKPLSQMTAKELVDTIMPISKLLSKAKYEPIDKNNITINPSDEDYKRILNPHLPKPQQ